MMGQEPKYWRSWKGRVIKAIAIDGAQTWQEIRDSTGLSSESLNKALSEMFDIGILEKTMEGMYRVNYDIYKEYREFFDRYGAQAPQKKIFLGYSSADRDKAKKIYRRLLDGGIEAFLAETELSSTDSIVDSLRSKIAVSDYVIIILSRQAAKFSWVIEELRYAVDSEFKARDVALIPILLDNYPIPNYLRDYQPINFRYNFERGVRKLLERIELIPEIDFTILDGGAFENLVADLLISLGFKDLERGYRSHDRRFDLKTLYSYKDPFGSVITETWLVEAKLYRDSRLDLDTLSRAVSYLSLVSGNYKLLLVTNSHLTSASRNWLEKLQEKERTQIRIIEGTELKALLLKDRRLVEKFFGRAQTGD